MVVVMECKSAEPVKKSKTLRVYTFEAPGHETLNIVANATNIYNVGDLVGIAKVGTILSSFDNLKIEPRKIFGVESFGMAVGFAPANAKIGDILGDDFEA